MTDPYLWALLVLAGSIAFSTFYLWRITTRLLKVLDRAECLCGVGGGSAWFDDALSKVDWHAKKPVMTHDRLVFSSAASPIKKTFAYRFIDDPAH